MINKQLNKVDLDDLNNLIQNAVLEGKTIEYKHQLPGDSDSDKKEFLADVSSFANTSGGDLIFGMTTDQGVPKSATGVGITNIDAEKLKYEEIIRNGLEPRINFSIHTVTVNPQRIVFIFRINKSWIGPHRVIFKGHDKFYARNSAGKYPLDTNELKIAFNLSDTLIEKINKFKIDRISQLSADNTPIPFYEEAKIVLHLVPIESFSPDYKADINAIKSDFTKLEPIYSSGWNHRVNLEGVLSYSGGRNDKSHSYVQLYRNGIIEAVDGLMLSPDDEKKYIPSIAYEKELLKSLAGYLGVLKDLNIATPIVMFLTFIGIKDYEMAVDRSRFWGSDHYKIDRDILQLPEVFIESYDIEVKDILRPLFDLVWNACGYERSYNFDEQGNWVAK